MQWRSIADGDSILLPPPKSTQDISEVQSGAQSPYRLQYPDPTLSDTVGISTNCTEMNVRTHYLTEWGWRYCLRCAWEKRRLRKWFTIGHMVNENNVICTVSAVFYIHMDNNFFWSVLSPDNQQESRVFLKVHSISNQSFTIRQTQPHFYWSMTTYFGLHWTSPSHSYKNFQNTVKVKDKGKAIPLQTTQRVPGDWGSQISIQSAHEGGKVVSPTHRPPLPPGDIHGTNFC